jgi:hypothetical protein
MVREFQSSPQALSHKMPPWALKQIALIELIKDIRRCFLQLTAILEKECNFAQHLKKKIGTITLSNTGSFGT